MHILPFTPASCQPIVPTCHGRGLTLHPQERGQTNSSANWKEQRNPKDSESPQYHKGEKKLPNSPSTQAQRVCLHETLINLSGLGDYVK